MAKYRLSVPDSKSEEVIKFLKKQKIKYKIKEENSMVSDVELKGWEKSYNELNNLSESDVKSKSKKKISTPVKRKKKSEDDFVLTPALKKLLDERLKDAKENPDAWETWETVRKRLKKKLKAKNNKPKKISDKEKDKEVYRKALMKKYGLTDKTLSLKGSNKFMKEREKRKVDKKNN